MTSPTSIVARFSNGRSGTTMARGSIVPDATSGRNGWYCMKFSAETSVTR